MRNASSLLRTGKISPFHRWVLVRSTEKSLGIDGSPNWSASQISRCSSTAWPAETEYWSGFRDFSVLAARKIYSWLDSEAHGFGLYPASITTFFARSNEVLSTR